MIPTRPGSSTSGMPLWRHRSCCRCTLPRCRPGMQSLRPLSAFTGPDGRGTTASSSVSRLHLGGSITRSELVAVRSRETTTGKVAAELKFVFWQKMFTQRFDARCGTAVFSCYSRTRQRQSKPASGVVSTRIWKSSGSCGIEWLITNRFLPEVSVMSLIRFWTSFNFVPWRFPHGFGQTSQPVASWRRGL